MPETITANQARRFATAPMIDWSNSACRVFWRQLTRYALVYTEMITAGAIIHGNTERFLVYETIEHPIALQLGGSNPADLARCARLAEQWGYDEVNLNCGCPSDRVQNGMFGACLMAKPQLVADCVKAMQDACTVPVTVKHRIGIDEQDSYEHMLAFVDTIASTGCKTFIVHARKAWLQGLSPKENREIPPLRYDLILQLKAERPNLEIIINGGLNRLEDCDELLTELDGVMLGRAAYQNPYLLATVDQRYFNSKRAIKSRDEIVDQLIPYIESQLSKGASLHHMTRHILGLYQGLPGAKLFRRHLSEQAHKKNAGIEVLMQALSIMQQARERMENYQLSNSDNRDLL